jgi:uncharacterized protein (UPF0335 family)
MRKPSPKDKPEPKTKLAANNQLKSLVDRIERLTEQRQEFTDDINEVFADAKASGYDIPALKMILRERKMDSAKLAERESIADVYRSALGMLHGSVFEDAARENVSAH